MNEFMNENMSMSQNQDDLDLKASLSILQVKKGDTSDGDNNSANARCEIHQKSL